MLWYAPLYRKLRATKLHSIIVAQAVEVEPEDDARYARQIAVLSERRKTGVTIEVLPLYNPELSRILYAFFCFEKQVT